MSLNNYRHAVATASSLDILSERIKGQIFGAIPAVVESFDPELKTISAQISLTEYSETDAGDEREEPWPKHEDVPVLFPGGGPLTITWPLEPGDPVLLIFCSRDIAEWMGTDGKEPVAPDDYRAHPEGACFALPRLYPEKRNDGKANGKDFIIAFKDGPEIHVKASGEITLVGQKIELGAEGASQALGLAPLIMTALNLLMAHTNTVGAILGVPPIATLPDIDSKKVFANG
jgi:hypothetical protein